MEQSRVQGQPHLSCSTSWNESDWTGRLQQQQQLELGEEEVVGAVQGPLLEWMNLYDQILNVCTPFPSMNLTDGW